MAELITVTFPKCGTCRFAQVPFKNNMADCYGRPPTPMLLGTSQDALGRPVLQMEVFSPKVKDDRPACALYEKRLDFATEGKS